MQYTTNMFPNSTPATYLWGGWMVGNIFELRYVWPISVPVSKAMQGYVFYLFLYLINKSVRMKKM